MDAQNFQPMKVLIVDDQSDNLKVLYNTLTTAGYDISLAKTGQQALDHITEYQPDLVLLDIILPDIDGFEICEKLKQDNSTTHIPVIFISARLDSKDVIRGFEAGGMDYIRKPFVEAEVLARVKHHLTLKTLQENLEHLVDIRTEALLKAKSVAEEANQEKSRFLSRMSHELRTPLNAILGFSQLQEQCISKSSGQMYSNQQYIKEAGYHLLKLVDDVLDINSIENNQLKIALQNINVDQAIHTSIGLVKEQAAQSGVKIHFEPSNLFIFTDKTRFAQVVIHLLSNAIKYNKRNGTVSVTAKLASDTEVEVRIEDTGVGISPNDYEKLFSPFTRLAYAEEQEIQGVGTGLSLSKYLIELMNGTIDFTSQPNTGSAFFVSLPIGEKVEDKIVAPLTHKKASTDICVHDVVYIEDNQPSRKLMEEIAYDYPNINLMALSNIQAAIEAVNTFEPRLILIDINLPGTNGIGAVKLLRKMFDKQNIKYVAVSADAMTEQIELALKIGFDDYITKPIDFDQVDLLFNGLGG